MVTYQARKMLEALEDADLDIVRNPLGYHQRASDWLEDGDGTTYYLATDGDLYVETDGGREFVGALSADAMARFR